MDPTQFQFDPLLSTDSLPSSWSGMDQSLIQSAKPVAVSSSNFPPTWSQLEMYPSPTEDAFNFNLACPSSLEGSWTSSAPSFPYETSPSTPSLSPSTSLSKHPSEAAPTTPPLTPFLSPTSASPSSYTETEPASSSSPAKRRRGRPRANRADSSGVSKGSTPAAGSGRTPHKYVEQKYRHSVTVAFQNLQSVVFPQHDDRERVGFGRMAPTKTAILIRARDYIQQLEQQNAELQEKLKEMSDAGM